ncbi:hypothetical protein H9P43_005591 [Blastocladiella emersonii ATCC 22665]|nr:hypothetical protein H9P43_005591 [Blastocladiella emersonii ATCC 22665]
MRPPLEPRQCILASILLSQAAAFHALVAAEPLAALRPAIEPLGLALLLATFILGIALSLSPSHDRHLPSASGRRGWWWPWPRSRPTYPLTVADEKAAVAAALKSIPAPGTKWCAICAVYVRADSLHCRYCDACVERMDHHCFYANNCIGRRNYRLFLVTLATILLHSGSQLAANLAAVVVIFVSGTTPLATAAWQTSLLVALALPLTAIFLFSAYLVILHVELARRGLTTIEYSRLIYATDPPPAPAAVSIDLESGSTVSPAVREPWTARIVRRFWCWSRRERRSTATGKTNDCSTSSAPMPEGNVLQVWPVALEEATTLGHGGSGNQ